LRAESLPTGRQEGTQYKRKVPYREATAFRAWSFNISGQKGEEIMAAEDIKIYSTPT
jgi:hypothetical protein